jgi:hypothetical protein
VRAAGGKDDAGSDQREGREPRARSHGGIIAPAADAVAKRMNTRRNPAGVG